MKKRRHSSDSIRSKPGLLLRLCLGVVLSLGTFWAVAYAGMMGGGMMGGNTATPQGDTSDNDPEAQLFQSDCGQCHALPSPLAHKVEQWPSVVERMRSHLRQNGDRDLSDEDVQAILGYLRKHAQH